jgi:hypothetical protein
MVKEYDFKTHSEMKPHMRAYIMEVSGAKRLEDVPLADINDFLNGLVEWESDPLYGKNYKAGRF